MSTIASPHYRSEEHTDIYVFAEHARSLLEELQNRYLADEELSEVTDRLSKLSEKISLHITSSYPAFLADCTRRKPIATSIEDVRTVVNVGVTIAINELLFTNRKEVAETILTPSIATVKLKSLAIAKAIKKQEAPQVIGFLEKIIAQLKKSIGFYHNQNPNNQEEVVALLNELGEYIISRISKQPEAHANGIPEMIELEKIRNILVVQMIYLQNPIVPNSEHFRYLSSKIKLAQSLIDDQNKLLNEKELPSPTYEDGSSEYRV